MSAGIIEHRGMVKHIDDGRATVVADTAAGGHGSHCGVGRLAPGKQATLRNLPAPTDLKEGNFVRVGLPESRLSLTAMLGYLFPVLATLAGALIGIAAGGNDSATALGAAAGFVVSLVVARIAISFTPGLSPTPQLIPHSALAAPFPQE